MRFLGQIHKERDSSIWTRSVSFGLGQFNLDRYSSKWTGTFLIDGVSFKLVESVWYGLGRFQNRDPFLYLLIFLLKMIFFSGSSKVGIVMSRASKTKSVNETRNDSKIKNRKKKIEKPSLINSRAHLSKSLGKNYFLTTHAKMPYLGQLPFNINFFREEFGIQ